MRSKSSRAAPHTEEKKEDDKFSAFVYVVFVAVVLGAGTIIMNLIKDNADMDKRITLIERSCLPPVVRRIHPAG